MKQDAEYSLDKLAMLLQLCEGCNATAQTMLVSRLALDLKATPRESALYRKQVCDLDNRIADIQMMFNTFIVTTREDVVGHLPFPSRINIKQTELRYGKGF